MLFYSDRDLEGPITDKKDLQKQLHDNPKKMWLSNSNEFKALNLQFPGKLYLIQGNSKYAFFTSYQNKEFVKYDFSGIKVPNVK